MKLYLAPLQGFTNSTFREEVSILNGCIDKTFSPFVDAKRFKREGDKVLKEITKSMGKQQRLIPQVLGSNPEGICAVLNRFKELGFDEANINMGCPFAPVASKQMGSGLLPYPEKIDEILSGALQTGLKISVKARLGWDNNNDWEQVAPIFNKYNLEEVIIHPRNGKQQYKGTTDLDAFEKFAKSLNAPVVYNGDINTLEQFQQLAERFDYIDSWMIGRGAIANPTIFKAIAEGQVQSRKEIAMEIKRLHNILLAEFSELLSGQSHILHKIQPYWEYFGATFEPELKRMVKKASKAGTLDNYKIAAADLFAKAFHEFE